MNTPKLKIIIYSCYCRHRGVSLVNAELTTEAIAKFVNKRKEEYIEDYYPLISHTISKNEFIESIGYTIEAENYERSN